MFHPDSRYRRDLCDCDRPSALLLTASTAGTVTAADLPKIDQTIRKEPSYQGSQILPPGLRAGSQECVWLVVDGDVLYVDCNGNGDLTGAERNRLVDG